MKKHNYILAKKGKSVCPECGKKTYVLYVDSGGSPLSSTVGKCDRLVNCGYHYPPKDFFIDNPTEKTEWKPQYKAVAPIKKEAPKPIDFIDYYLVHKNLTNGKKMVDCDFAEWLYTMFPEKKTEINTTLWRFLCGKDSQKRIIFSYFDITGRYRTGKHMAYDPKTGKRIKDKEGSINWTHSILKKKRLLPESYNMQLCLFGELQLQKQALNATSPVAIVESEKTAIISSILMPNYIWLAAGALGWLSVEKLKPLKGRTIVLFPDTSKEGAAFAKWSTIASEAKRKGYNIMISDLLEKECAEEQKEQGFDIVDYFLTTT